MLLERGMCTEDCEGVGGPDEVGDNGSVTQSLKAVSTSSAYISSVL